MITKEKTNQKMETVGDRLKYLRKTYNFTQKQVADYLNFKQSQIVKLEKNQRKLKLSSLEKLCDLYQCDEDYILYGKGKYTKPKFAFRSKNKNIDLRVMADMNRIIKNLEFLDEMSQYLDEKKIIREDKTKKYYEINELASQCRKEWDVNEYDSIDIFQVAQNKIKNLTIVFTDLGNEISGACNKEHEEKVIFINSLDSIGRQRFTLAHEIYHLKYDDNTYSICDVNSNEKIEKEADNFASSLLMPHRALINFKLENNIQKWDMDSIIQAEQFFQISHHAMLWRIRQLGDISYVEYQELKIYPIYNASLRGYDTRLYETPKDKKFFTIGNYLRLTEDIYNEGLISHGKKEELLSDAYRQDLIFNIPNMGELIE